MLVFKKRDELLGREAAYSTVTCCKARNTQAEIFPGICSFYFVGSFCHHTFPSLLLLHHPNPPPPFTAGHFLKSQTRHFPQFLITSSSSNSARKFDVSSSFGRLYSLQLGSWPTHGTWARSGHKRPRSVGVFVFSSSVVFQRPTAEEDTDKQDKMPLCHGHGAGSASPRRCCECTNGL